MTMDSELKEIYALIDECIDVIDVESDGDAVGIEDEASPDIRQLSDLGELEILLDEATEHGFLDYVKEADDLSMSPDVFTQQMEDMALSVQDLLQEAGQDAR
jgi:hypothetical protein